MGYNIWLLYYIGVDGDITDLTENPITFHEYCQKRKTKKINFFPYGSLLGIPLHIGWNGHNSNYVLSYYEIINKPPFITNHPQQQQDKYCIAIVTHSDLKFSTGETLLIRNFYSDSFVINSTDKVSVLDAFKNYSILNIACHADYGLLKLKISDTQIDITSDDIKPLDLSKCELVFLNACRTSTRESYGSLISDSSSLPFAFLEAGVKVVISTTTEINDDDAFRISTKFHELYTTSKDTPSAILRKVLLMCMDNTLPYYEDKLSECGQHDLSSHMTYLKKYGNSESINSWEYYSIWENNYA